MTLHAVLGSLLGIFIGLLPAFLIGWLSRIFLVGAPENIIPFLGMGAGAVLGGILGGIVGIRRKE